MQVKKKIQYHQVKPWMLNIITHCCCFWILLEPNSAMFDDNSISHSMNVTKTLVKQKVVILYFFSTLNKNVFVFLIHWALLNEKVHAPVVTWRLLYKQVSWHFVNNIFTRGNTDKTPQGNFSGKNLLPDLKHVINLLWTGKLRSLHGIDNALLIIYFYELQRIDK